MLCAPTGGGKTVMAFDLIRQHPGRVILYTHRKMLFDQISAKLKESGIIHGLRASGYPDHLGARVQLAMIQSDHSRAFKHNKIPRHDADLVIVDECHAHKGKQMKQILEHYDGVKKVGLSASPVNVGHLWHEVAYAGFNSDMLKCGLHVPVYTYAPDEPDLSRLHRDSEGEYSPSALERRFRGHTIMGSIFKHYYMHNPEGLPTIVFAPSVGGSRHIAEELSKRGIRCAHLDGYNAWFDGEEIKSSKAVRDNLVSDLLDGKIDAISNRFVLREGIDIPQLYCGILATTFGYTSYIQACGRLLRSHPSLDHVKIIDHGGNWWRWGSIDMDREYELTETALRQPRSWKCPNCMRFNALKDKQCECGYVKLKIEGWRCPKCMHTQHTGKVCEQCGAQIQSRERVVRQLDGTLKLVTQKAAVKDPVKLWKSMFWACRQKQTRIPFRIFARWFESKHPPNKVVVFNGKTAIKDGQGTYHIIKQAPYPKSKEWDEYLYSVEFRRLQYPD